MAGRRLTNIVDRPVSKGKTEVSAHAFAFLFSELIQYSQARVTQISELETRLSDVGYEVGFRMLELIAFREKSYKRETRLIGILLFIHTVVWKILFNKTADSLEKITDREDSYMIVDNNVMVNKYISTPKEMSGLNCAAYVAGVIEGILNAAEFPTEKVTAHFQPQANMKYRTIFLVKFKPEVISRDKLLGPS
eukprot:TRINITY_DN378_c0_g1_i1.p1 TRINITY_DN378_c0_g1~~TRINITY_DN378_c0_g1_i1.p1  ORF type:complete len:193 (-),score=25.28 TRINITY_DN378_c0_g1_i1:64-642(-)